MAKVLVACEYSGVVRRAFAARGHIAISCDLLPAEDDGDHYQGDVLDILDAEEWDLMVAHPPCTRLTNSGVRWLNDPPPGRSLLSMWNELGKGAEFYRKLREAPIRFKAIENPIMHKYAKQLLGDSERQIIQPWQFGEPAFKATGFELFNLPPLKPTRILKRPARGTADWVGWSEVFMASPGEDRWKDRSRTYKGIAEAMAQQWGDYVG